MGDPGVTIDPGWSYSGCSRLSSHTGLVCKKISSPLRSNMSSILLVEVRLQPCADVSVVSTWLVSHGLHLTKAALWHGETNSSRPRRGQHGAGRQCFRARSLGLHVISVVKVAHVPDVARTRDSNPSNTTLTVSRHRLNPSANQAFPWRTTCTLR